MEKLTKIQKCGVSILRPQIKQIRFISEGEKSSYAPPKILFRQQKNVTAIRNTKFEQMMEEYRRTAYIWASTLITEYNYNPYLISGVEEIKDKQTVQRLSAELKERQLLAKETRNAIRFVFSNFS